MSTSLFQNFLLLLLATIIVIVNRFWYMTNEFKLSCTFFQPINPLPPATSSTDLIQRKDEDISAKKVCHESRWTNYRVTHQVVQNLPLTSKHKFWFGLAWLGQNGTFVLKSRGGFAQPDVTPGNVEWAQSMISLNWPLKDGSGGLLLLRVHRAPPAKGEPRGQHGQPHVLRLRGHVQRPHALARHIRPSLFREGNVRGEYI